MPVYIIMYYNYYARQKRERDNHPHTALPSVTHNIGSVTTTDQRNSLYIYILHGMV